MARALWLPDALRAEGVTVVEYPGWRERGGSRFTPKGVICHHTAGPARGDAPSLGTCVHGRPDLPGPLAQIVLARSGTAHVIASGKANHAGAGRWQGITGNSNVLGIEAENTGRGEPWPTAQYDAYVRCCAAICRHLGLPAGMVCGHKEWATPRGRKIDPAGIDMATFRAAVAARLTRPGTKPSTPTQEDDMTPDDRKTLDAARAEAAAAGLRAQACEQKLDRLLAWATRVEAKLAGKG